MPKPERQLIEQVRRRASKLAQKGGTVVIGIGDDCAVLRPPAGHELLVTTDFSLEGVHFRRDWHPPESIGHRCLTRGLSDIAAMGGQPLAAFLSLALPADLPQKWVDAFYSGLLALARCFHVTLAGGDTAQSPAGILADIMVIGSVPRGRAILRSTAKPGDRIYVTGKLGESAAEIRRRYADLNTADLKGRGFSRAVNNRIISSVGASAPDDRFLYPEPRLALAPKLQSLASAMIDITDGLSTDLAHICDESHVGAVIYEHTIPIAPNATLDDALHGGDDYELLFSSSKRVPNEIAGVPITEIGKVAKRSGLRIQDNRGKAKELRSKGWQHFSK